MNYRLPSLVSKMAGPFVIYGTGEIAEKFCEELTELSLYDKVVFYMNSNLTAETFKERKVYSVTQVETMPDRDQFIYLIASYGTASVMAENLYSIGIAPEKIVFPELEHLKENESFLPLLRKKIERICYYPKIFDESVMEDLQARIAWYLPPSWKVSVTLPCHNSMNEKDLEDELKSCDLILVWDQANLPDRIIQPFKFKTVCMDPGYLKTRESDVYRRLLYWSLSKEERASYERISRENFTAMLTANKYKKKAYVFGSGPSLDSALNFTFEDTFKIVVNTVIKSKKVLDHIKPDLLTISDPVLFSYCEFGRAFRKHLTDLINNSDIYVVIPDFCMPLMLSHYPGFRKRLIGIAVTSDQFHFPTPDVLTVKETRNVITRFALPIASTIADEICIIGCDGTNQPSQLWDHSSLLQHDSLLESAYRSHTSLFKMYSSTKEYYDKHCEMMELLLKYGEAKGKKYCSLTPSFIPALVSRMCAQ